MIENLAIITNTNSVNSDLWDCHIGQMHKYLSNKHYVFSDVEVPNPDVTNILYNSEDKFRTQFLNCLKQVKEEYCLYLNEDYLLFDKPDLKKLEEYVGVLKSLYSLSFIRLAKGIDHFHIPMSPTLNYLDCRNPYFFSQTASLWKTSHLLAIHEHGPDLHIAGEDMSQQFEVAASDVCRGWGIQGFYHHDGEAKRGEHHYDSNVFPYTASALVKGKWNFKEYKSELFSLKEEYNLNFDKRGIYQ